MDQEVGENLKKCAAYLFFLLYSGQFHVHDRRLPDALEIELQPGVKPIRFERFKEGIKTSKSNLENMLAHTTGD